MKTQIPFLKQFGEWVTGLTDRYQNDPIFQVQVQVALMQVVLTIFMAVFLFGLYHYQSATAPTFLQSSLNQAGGNPGSPGFQAAASARRLQLFIIFFLIFFLLSTIFSVVVGHVAMRPSKNTLSFQKRFIGNIAHEIRTPLAIIKTSTEVTLFDPNLPKDVRETMEQTIVELNRVSETINNLLSFDSLTRPKTMQFEPVNLETIARTVAERHQDLAKSRGVELATELIDSAMVLGNATALEQVLTNLTKNAINYTPQNKNGRVTITLDRGHDRGIAVSVIDTGIGIAQKDLYHIFEPFYRADTSRARGIGTGTSGLGLAIVNEIVRLHHGTITLRSAIGHGTTIKIAFPALKETANELPLMSPSGSPLEATLDFSHKA